MIAKRRALLAALLVGGSAVPAGAGCFDWLWGKSTPPSTAATAAVPPTTITPLGPPVAVGPPTVTVPPATQLPATTAAPSWSVQPAAPAASAYSANYGNYLANPAASYNSAAALQMPAYGATALPAAPVDNRSVLTGQPVNPSAPIQPVWGQAAVNANSLAPQTSYNAAAAYQAAPQIQPAQPLAPAAMAQPPLTTSTPSGFFGKIFGNNYQTQYNPVPTTVFRPVQQVDPVTGQVTVVQQPCTTTLQQVQRSPYTAWQPAPVQTPPPAHAGESNCGGESPLLGSTVPTSNWQPQYQPQQYQQPPAYQQPAAQYQQPPVYQQPAAQYQQHQQPGYQPAPQSYPQPSSTAQGLPPSNGYLGPIGGSPSGTAPASGYSDPSFGSAPVGSGVQPAGGGYGDPGYNAPIPSTDPLPLQGSPNDRSPNDRSPVGQPSLSAPPLSARPAWDSNPASPPPATPSQPSVAEPASGGEASSYSDLPPIPAADGYQPPTWSTAPASGSSHRGGAVTEPTISAPSWNDRTASNVLPQTDSGQTRYAGLQLGQAAAATAAAQPQSPAPRPSRSSGGWRSLAQ